MDVHAIPPTHHGVRQAIIEADTIPPEEMIGLLVLAGRVHGPYLLTLAWDTGRIDRDTLARYIGDVWNAAEFPDKALTRQQWVSTFHDAGFTHNGERVERPTEPVTLYRGASYRRRRLMSWTSDRSVAVAFAVRRAALLGDDCSVWRTVAPPEAILCINDGPGSRDESEWVIDTRGLRIVEDEPAVGLARKERE